MKHEVEQVVRKLEGIGWTLEGLAGSGHYRMSHDNGATVMVPATPSDGRWKANLIAEAERACGQKIERPAAGRYRNQRARVSNFDMSLAERAESRRLDRVARRLRDELDRFALVLSLLEPGDVQGARQLMRTADRCVEAHEELRAALRPVEPLPPLVLQSSTYPQP